jgi:hypothetical protein
MKNERGIWMFELLQLKDRRRIERRGGIETEEEVSNTPAVCVIQGRPTPFFFVRVCVLNIYFFLRLTTCVCLCVKFDYNFFLLLF